MMSYGAGADTPVNQSLNGGSLANAVDTEAWAIFVLDQIPMESARSSCDARQPARSPLFQLLASRLDCHPSAFPGSGVNPCPWPSPGGLHLQRHAKKGADQDDDAQDADASIVEIYRNSVDDVGRHQELKAKQNAAAEVPSAGPKSVARARSLDYAPHGDHHRPQRAQSDNPDAHRLYDDRSGPPTRQGIGGSMVAKHALPIGLSRSPRR